MTKKTRTAIMVAVAGAVAGKHLDAMLTLFVEHRDGVEAIAIVGSILGAEPNRVNVMETRTAYSWDGSLVSIQVTNAAAELIAVARRGL